MTDNKGRAQVVTEAGLTAIDKLDSALCQFLNNVGDEYDPRVWLPSVRRDLDALNAAYNDCHRVGVMDIQRATAAENVKVHYATGNGSAWVRLSDHERVVEELKRELADLQHDIERAQNAATLEATARVEAEAQRDAAVDRVAELEAALEPFAEFAPFVSQFVEGRAKFSGSNVLPTKHFRRAHFERAAELLARRAASARGRE
jgi:hypothetical protein